MTFSGVAAMFLSAVPEKGMFLILIAAILAAIEMSKPLNYEKF